MNQKPEIDEKKFFAAVGQLILNIIYKSDTLRKPFEKEEDSFL